MTAPKALHSTPENKAALELEGFEERCERYKEKIKDYTIVDDIFMRNVFITRNDILGYNRPICHINRKVEEENEAFEDREHIIYVNSKKQEDTELGRLMHDLHCKDEKDIHSDILLARVYELKETEKGVREMCRDMEEIYSEGMEKGMESGRLLGLEEGEYIGAEKKAKETVLALAEMKMPIEQIAQAVKVTIEVVQSWIGENMVATK